MLQKILVLRSSLLITTLMMIYPYMITIKIKEHL
jgi:hypothetical protein